ncbi:MAG: VWA domain-containing protein [Bacteroidota bacterium]
MIRFEHPALLYALVLVPLLLLIHYFSNRRLKKRLNRLADHPLHEKLAPSASFSRRNWKHAFFLLALIFLILAAANPQIGSRMKKAKRTGIDLVIALDVSNSMLAQDIKPNRLTNARRAIDRLIGRLEGDRLGLVIFAGNAYSHLPITTDYSAAKMFVQSVNTDIVPTQGTAIGEAIEQSISAFGDDSENNKAIIIISDGENHEDNAVKMAEKAADEGIVVHTIGMGSISGAPIPVSSRNGAEHYKQDETGNTVISQLNQEMLQEIASAGNGTYITANNTRAGVNKLYDKIREMEQHEFETRVYADYEDRFQYPLALALLLILIEHLMYNRKNPWMRKVRLFEPVAPLNKGE